MGKSLVSIWYVSSFTLCWLSLLDGLLGFKVFIGKVDNPPFLLWDFSLTSVAIARTQEAFTWATKVWSCPIAPVAPCRVRQEQ